MVQRRYCLITPVRDEERYARRALDAVVRQTIPPTLWVIVDDGSKDQTPGILAEYASKYPFIKVLRRKDRGYRKLGGGVIDAFYEGYDTIDPDQFDYVCKFDLDLDLPTDYFERVIQHMEAEPRLGTFSGKPYYIRPETIAGRRADQPHLAFPIQHAPGLVAETCGDENSVGMIKFYRTECFKEIGGFVRELMWDGIDCHRCRMFGWMAASWDEPSLRFHHLRPMGTSDKNWWTGRERHGMGQYFMGTGPTYLLASAAFRLLHPPVVLGSIAMIWGYVKSALNHKPRYDDLEFRRYLRRYQWMCLLRGKKRATNRINRGIRQGKVSDGAPSTAPAHSAPIGHHEAPT